MELRISNKQRSISNVDGLISVNKRHHNEKQSLSKLKKEKSVVEVEEQNILDISRHEAYKFIRGTNPTKIAFKKFVTVFYKGLHYSVNNLKGPSQQFIKKKSVILPEPKNSKKKFLLLDLDQTLIHSVFTQEKTDVNFTLKDQQFKFNIRPYCFEFLQKMNQLYTIYVFTASTANYAQPIVNFLNEKSKTIQGVLNRKNCMETYNGFFIKDLRIIKNRSLKDLILIDNLVHSFGLQLDNGIPILQYVKGKQDRELKGIEQLLVDMHNLDDVRDYIAEKIKIREVLQVEEDEFLLVDERRCQSLYI